MNAPFTALDVLVFVVVALSGVLAMLRGFTREVLSILSWIVALGAAAYAYLNTGTRDYVRTLVQPDWLADAVLVGATFLFVLIVISFITVRLTDFILDSKVGAIDRTLGLVFGLARGAALVAVAYLFATWLIPPEQQPDWVLEAQSRPLMESSRETILSLLPEDPEDLIEQLPSELRDRIGGSSGGADAAPPVSDEPTTQPDPTPNSISPEIEPIVEERQEREAWLSAPGFGHGIS